MQHITNAWRCPETFFHRCTRLHWIFMRGSAAAGRREAVSDDPFLSRPLRLRMRDEVEPSHLHRHQSPLAHPGGYGGGLKQISPNEVSGPAATVQCVGRLWAANQHAATANGGISIGRLFHIQPGWSAGGSTLQPAFSNRWAYWCDARHQSWETENVYSPMWMDSTYSQAQNQKKTRIKKAHESAIIRHLCNKLRGFNKTAVPPSSNTLLYRLASLFNLDGGYLPKPPATPCQILPCFFLSFFPLSLFSFSFSFSFPHRVALS